jgi:pimeloyl-ACP methyl ester carboxylesterase
MAPTVVLLHAFPLDKRMWDDVVGPIADSGWDVVVPDLLGFGESLLDADDLDDAPTLAAQARGVLSILDQIGLSNVVVCGLSLGGYVAMELVRQDPSRIAGIALVDTKATADTDEARANRLRVAEQVLESGSTDALARAMLPNLLGETTRTTRPEVVERVTGWIREADPVGVATAQRAMAARPDSLADLASLVVPGLVLWGSEDTLAPRSEQDLMVEAMRDARFVEIPGCGHLAAVEAPEATAAALVAFLRDVENLPRHT